MCNTQIKSVAEFKGKRVRAVGAAVGSSTWPVERLSRRR
jgi:hypothetical protein